MSEKLSQITWHEQILDIPIYEQRILICHGDNMVDARNYYKDELGKYKSRDKKFSGMFSYHDKRGFPVIFFEIDFMTQDVLAHEAFHLTAYIMHLVGIKYHPTNHEAFSYLLGWLVRELCYILPVKYPQKRV